MPTNISKIDRIYDNCYPHNKECIHSCSVRDNENIIRIVLLTATEIHDFFHNVEDIPLHIRETVKLAERH